MCKGYAMIANGLKMMAAGYELLANMDTAKTAEDTSAVPVQEEKTSKPETAEVKAEAPKEEPIMSLTDLRAFVRQKMKEGKMEQCQEVMKSSYGCDRLSDIPEEKRAEYYRKLEVI